LLASLSSNSCLRPYFGRPSRKALSRDAITLVEGWRRSRRRGTRAAVRCAVASCLGVRRLIAAFRCGGATVRIAAPRWRDAGIDLHTFYLTAGLSMCIPPSWRIEQPADRVKERAYMQQRHPTTIVRPNADVFPKAGVDDESGGNYDHNSYNSSFVIDQPTKALQLSCGLLAGRDQLHFVPPNCQRRKKIRRTGS
jgi:hypothetical protein